MPIVFIREGATDNTWVDYWMDGSYSTIIRSDSEIYLELEMILHVPKLEDDYRYMIWFQFENDYLTRLKDDYNQYYESYSCTIHNTEKARETSKTGLIDKTALVWAGYRGKEDFTGA